MDVCKGMVRENVCLSGHDPGYVCLSVCLLVRLVVCCVRCVSLSVGLFVTLTNQGSFLISVCVFVPLDINGYSLSLSVCLSVRLSVHPLSQSLLPIYTTLPVNPSTNPPTIC